MGNSVNAETARKKDGKILNNVEKISELNGELSFLSKKISRRKALSTGGKAAVGIAAAAIIAGGGYAAYVASQPPQVVTSTVTQSTTATTTATSTATTTATTTAVSTSVSTTGLAGQPVVFGGTLPLSGPVAAGGVLSLNGYNMAIEKINAEGGINGRPAQLKVYDDAFDLTKIQSLYTKLIQQDKVDLVFGPYGAAPNYTAFGTVKSFDVPMFVGNAVAVPQGSAQAELYVDQYSEPNQPAGGYYAGLYRYMKNFSTWNKQNCNPPKSAAYVLMNTPFGVDVYNLFTVQMEGIGISTAYKTLPDEGTTDFTPIIAQVEAANPDLLVFSGFFGDGVQFHKQFIQQAKNIPMFYWQEGSTQTDWWAHPEDGGVDPSIADGVMSYSNVGQSTNYHGGWADWFLSTYQQRFSVYPSVFGSLSAFSIMEYAAKVAIQANAFDTASLLNVAQGQSIDTAGGPTQIDKNGRNVKMQFGSFQWQQQPPVPILLWPPEYADGAVNYTCGGTANTTTTTTTS